VTNKVEEANDILAVKKVGKGNIFKNRKVDE